MRRALLLLPLLLLPAGAEDGAPAEAAEKAPPKPTPEAVAQARTLLAARGADRLLERYTAVEVLRRAGGSDAVGVLFKAAVGTIYPDLAVAAGEAANALDPEAALSAYDGRGKLRDLESANAVRFLGEIRSKAALARLVDQTHGNQPEARVEALYGIVKQGDPSAYPHLVAALRMKDFAIRVPAAICCGLARVQDAGDLLLKGLEETKEDYAWYCAWALGRLRDPALLDRVAAATKGGMSGDVGMAKAKALAECAFDAQAHVPTLLRLTKHSHEGLAGAAAWALGRLGRDNPEAVDALRELATQARDETLAHLAVDALGRIGGPEAGERILARFASNPGAARGLDLKALGLLKTSAAADLLLQLGHKGRSSVLRKRAAIAFWQSADEAGRAAFRKRLEGAGGRAFDAGCQMLGFDQSASGFEFALDLLKKHYGRKSALRVREALERMTGHRFSTEPGIWSQWFAKHPDFFERKPQLLDREAWRQQLLENKLEMGISKETEAAVERGLAWLARHQSPDGRWVGDKFYDRCPLYHRKKCQVGARLGGWDVGMTGIALLAFYGAGYRPHEGRYKDTVLRGQVFIAARQWADGDFGGQGDLIGGYTRPIGAIALAEAYGTTQEEEYFERAERSVAHLVRIQYDDAGWRYRLSGQFPGDTSVTGWNAWAIATARKFGVPVDPMGLEGANSLIELFSSPVTQDEEFYDHDPRYFFDVGRGQEYEHFTGYNARENSRPPMTAIGLICKIFMGHERSHPYCIGAANRLLRSIPEFDERNRDIKYTAGAEYPSYYWYYGSLAMYQMGGRFWRQWSRPLLTEAIPAAQVREDGCEDGSWDCGNLDSIGGRVYTTAMCVLTLETFYRYLPSLSLK